MRKLPSELEEQLPKELQLVREFVNKEGTTDGKDTG